MTTLGNKDLSRRIVEEMWNTRNLNIIDEVYAPAEDGHEPTKQFMAMYLAAFPDLHITIVDQVSEGDRVATRFTARGTHQGPFAGIPATAHSMSITAIETHRFVEGKLVEVRNSIDFPGMVQQLRALSNRAVVGRWYEEYINAHNLSALDDLVSASFMSHFLSGNEGKPAEEIKAIDGMLFAALPDLHITIEDFVTAGDRAAVRYSSRGTPGGSAVPLTGSGMDFFRIADGKIAERWAEMDYTGFLKQMGG